MGNLELIGITGAPYRGRAHKFFEKLSYIHLDVDKILRELVETEHRREPTKFGLQNYNIREILYGCYKEAKVYHMGGRTSKQMVRAIHVSMVKEYGKGVFIEALRQRILQEQMYRQNIVVTDLYNPIIKDLIVNLGGRLIDQTQIADEQEEPEVLELIENKTRHSKEIQQ